ncbi:MAG: hypothetical protein ACLP4R_29975 [Solirubrobacteraceae bacterium]
MSEWITALSIVAPAVTGVLGYRFAGINEENRDIRQAKRGQVARDAERKSRLQDRNHDFQREVLLGLQDQVRRLGRACFRVIMQDLKTLDEQGKLFGLPEDLNQETYDAGIAFLEAMNRVTDDGLRHHLRTFYEYANGGVDTAVLRVKDSPSEQIKAELHAAQNKLTDLMVRASDALGEVLRQELRWEELP